jgi:dethiobiotin synthetase
MSTTEPSALIYCRALPLSRVREFSGWPGVADVAERVVYLHQDLSVTDDPDPGSERLFVSTTPQWRQFCRDHLGMSAREAAALGGHEDPPAKEASTDHGAMVLLGVGSNVGKSQVAYALCRMSQRLARRTGFFKSLLIGHRRVPANDSGHVGAELAEYASALDAPLLQASNPCFFDSHANELLVLGHPCGNYKMTAVDNVDFSSMPPAQLQSTREIVLTQYANIRANNDFVVVEGGGSCTDDIRYDFSNGFLAANVNAHVVLVASGANGGFAAALTGTYELLPESVRRRVRGFICNQVDPDLPQVRWNLQRVTERLGIECFGCIPHIAGASSMSPRQWADTVCDFLARGAIMELMAQ